MLLLQTLGNDSLHIYNSFRFKTPEQNHTIDEILAQFDNSTIGEVSKAYQCSQQVNENLRTFLSAFRNLLKTCNFSTTCKDSILGDQIVLERHHTLGKCIDLCKAAENAA